MQGRSQVSRRQFLTTSTLAAAAAVAAPTVIPRGVLASADKPGANEQIVIGFIGTGSRARQLMDHVPAGGKIVAVADCFLRRAEEAVQEKKADWKVYQDYRKMFEAEKLDAVFVVTPDHGRTLPCIRACQAGLDVYAEKPLTAYVAEGRALVNAVRKYKRVLQVGSQQRSMEMNRFACEFVRNGGLGKLQYVQGMCYSGPKTYPGLPEEKIPDGDDWDTWCGPTPLRPFNNQLQFAWMQWRDYSGGEMTNWGAHGIDQIQWALGASQTGPVELWPAGDCDWGKKVSMKYASGMEVRLELTRGPEGGGIFVGEKGKIEINRNKFTTSPRDLVQDPPLPVKAEIWEGPGWIARPHIQNFLDCVKSREKPNADVEIGHRSISVSHLVNITREVNRKLKWNPETEQFVGDEEANKLLDRPRRKGYELPTI